MNVFYKIKAISSNLAYNYNLYHEMVKSLFVLVRPSYFKDDCYYIDHVTPISPTVFKKICEILAVVTSDRDSSALFEGLKVKVFGNVVKPFYYMDYSQNNGFYSLPELFIINKVVELCYSELISYEPFQKFTNTCKIKLLNNEASVLEKAAWISNRYSNFLLEASNWTEIDPINYYFSDEPVAASDLLKSEYKELASVDINLEHQSSPVNNELFWDNLIYSKAQKIEFMFDYYKYIDIDSSIHSIKDIINLFDQKAMFGQLENTESFRLDKEELWTAMIYDAIYYTYINVSLLNCNEKYQTSFKMMCKQFYEQYASPVISEKARGYSFFDIFFSIKESGDNTEYQFSPVSYRKLKYAFKKLCEFDNYSFFSAFKDNLIPHPRNTHFTSSPEFYETILFYVILYSNIQNNGYINTSKFKEIYRESIGLDSTKQKNDDTIFHYEVGWYLLIATFNNAINVSCKFDNSSGRKYHSTKMLFTSQMLDSAPSEIWDIVQECHDDIVYILSLVILKIMYCDGEEYKKINSSIKSLIVHKEATVSYKINLHISDDELALLFQRKRVTHSKTNKDPKLKERLNLKGKTIDRIRILFESTNAVYSKKEIMFYCDRKKASVERALYQLIRLGEIKRAPHHNSREEKFERNITINERMDNIFRRKNK